MAETAGDTQGANSQRSALSQKPILTSPTLTEEPNKKRSAFAELMSTKAPKQSKPEESTAKGVVRTSKSKFYAKHHGHSTGDPRNGLLAYIIEPESFPSHVVIRTTPHTVLIRDLYPKATIHLLLLARSERHRDLHPHDAFADQSFLDLMKSETASAVKIATSELSRLMSPYSLSSKTRNDALDSPEPPDVLPQGRDFSREFKVGIHAHPSMSHFHIHIISKDMHSECMKHRKHYNSFNTSFFIPIKDYPLPEDDQRKETIYQNANLKADFRCWRCGRNFGNKFKDLKAHLDIEYESWRKE